MAVLVEAISVIVRRDAINARFSGGWRNFLKCVPNSTLCFDDDLARVGFMVPPDVEAFVNLLERGGLVFQSQGYNIDIAIVDQLRGPTMPVKWLEFAHLSLGDTGNKVAACWLFEEPRTGGHGLYMQSLEWTLATPDSWIYEDSLSANFTFVANEEMQEKLKFLRHENGNDVYLDLSTGKEMFVGRPKV